MQICTKKNISHQNAIENFRLDNYLFDISESELELKEKLEVRAKLEKEIRIIFRWSLEI